MEVVDRMILYVVKQHHVFVLIGLAMAWKWLPNVFIWSNRTVTDTLKQTENNTHTQQSIKLHTVWSISLTVLSTDFTKCCFTPHTVFQHYSPHMLLHLQWCHMSCLKSVRVQGSGLRGNTGTQFNLYPLSSCSMKYWFYFILYTILLLLKNVLID